MVKVFVFNDTSRNGHYGCSAVSYTLNKQLQKNNIEVVGYWPCRFDWRQYSDSLFQQLEKADAFIVNGEGTIHDSALRPRVAFCSEVAKVFKDKLNKPTFLINASIQNLDEKTLDDLKYFNAIFVRESTSARYLESFNICSTVVPDLSFGSLPEFVPLMERCGVLFTDSVFKNISELLRDAAVSTGNEFEGMSYPKLSPETFLRKVNRKKRHILNKISGKSSKQLPSLYEFSGSCFEHQIWIQKLLSKKFVITGRFHTVTMCILAQTPFVAVKSNTSKIESLLLDVFGSTDRMIEIDALGANSISSVIDSELSKFSPKEIDMISKYLQECDVSIHRMFVGISSMISSA